MSPQRQNASVAQARSLRRRLTRSLTLGLSLLSVMLLIEYAWTGHLGNVGFYLFITSVFVLTLSLMRGSSASLASHVADSDDSSSSRSAG